MYSRFFINLYLDCPVDPSRQYLPSLVTYVLSTSLGPVFIHSRIGFTFMILTLRSFIYFDEGIITSKFGYVLPFTHSIQAISANCFDIRYVNVTWSWFQLLADTNVLIYLHYSYPWVSNLLRILNSVVKFHLRFHTRSSF